MASVDIALKEAMTIEGSIGVALVDYNSGMALGALGGTKDFDLNVAADHGRDPPSLSQRGQVAAVPCQRLVGEELLGLLA